MDVKDLAKDLGKEMLDYVKSTIEAAVHDQEVDHTHPTITATTSTGRELVVADAKNRSWRTFLQGLTIDLAAALIVILGTITQINTPMDKTAWIAVGALAVKTLVQAALSYFMRIKIQPTIKNPEGEKMAIMPLMAPMPSEGRHEA